MRVMLLHNRYRHAGGEDAVVRDEAELLRSRGHEVVLLEIEQDATERNAIGRVWNLATNVTWSHNSYAMMTELCASVKPDVVHVHNFWMQYSPSVHAACHSAGVATVQTLHNFRLLCANANFLRDGRVCEDCLGGVAWRGVAHRCYRDSYVASGAVVAMSAFNKWRGTWHSDVDAFIALCENSRDKFVAGGLPAGRLFVKPNFVAAPQHRPKPPSHSRTIVYAGRLSAEKGVDTLVKAWATAGNGLDGELHIFGDGPERARLQQIAAGAPGITFFGSVPAVAVMNAIARARAVVVPSLCYENFPRVVAEAFSLGRPVLGSNIGAVGELITEGRTGLKFTPGEPQKVQAAARAVLNDDALADRLGATARNEFDAKYTPGTNYELLMNIYRSAREFHRARTAAKTSVGPASAAAAEAVGR